MTKRDALDLTALEECWHWDLVTTAEYEGVRTQEEVRWLLHSVWKWRIGADEDHDGDRDLQELATYVRNECLSMARQLETKEVRTHD